MADAKTETAGDDRPEKGKNADGTDRLEFYCPGCGRQAAYQRQCRGKAESPHPPIDMIESAELDGAPDDHTPAPNTDHADLAHLDA